MSVIRLLNKHVAELIAAGEVVDRPASVIKELVENSIDAGASKITVEIKNGGISYMRVTDNGCGISREDVQTAFLRHATSKINSSSDLDSIMTLGFRGEALASICAVAKVSVLTKTPDSQFGTSYSISGGEGLAPEDAGCPDGTTIVVRDLFYNTPARMKFLKKDVTEAIAVSGILDKIAISNPEISFTFLKDGQEVFYTDGDGDWLSCIRAVCGKDFSDGLIKVDYSYENFRVSGYISKPLAARKNRSKQYFFINSRFVKSLTAMSALEEAYKNSIMVGKFPSCVLNIELPHDFVDVNVHPSKTEVRFSNEKPVFYTVYYGVKTALESDEGHLLGSSKQQSISDPFKSVYAVDNNAVQTRLSEKVQNTEESKERFCSVPPRPINSSHLSVSAPKAFLIPTEDVKPSQTSFSQDAEEVFAKPAETNSKEDFNVTSEITEFDYNIIGEAFKTYIVCQTENEMIFIDKHAAHERIIFNTLSKDGDVPQQILLTPSVVTLSKEEYSVVINSVSIIEKSGFLIEDFGFGKILVRAAPIYITAGEISETLEEIAELLLKNKKDVITDKLDWIYHSIACRAAVKGGDTTGELDNEHLVEVVLKNKDIQFCPHGRPVMFKMTRREIEKKFGRLQ